MKGISHQPTQAEDGFQSVGGEKDPTKLFDPR
jgi:hypothetical protein